MAELITPSFITSEPLMELVPARLQFPRLESVLTFLVTSQQRVDDDIRTLQHNLKDVQRILVKVETDLDNRYSNITRELASVSTKVDGLTSRADDADRFFSGVKNDFSHMKEIQTKTAAQSHDNNEKINFLTARFRDVSSEMEAISKKSKELFEALKNPAEAMSRLDAALVRVVQESDNMSEKIRSFNGTIAAMKQNTEDLRVQVNGSMTTVGRVEKSIKDLMEDLNKNEKENRLAHDRLTVQQAESDHTAMSELAAMRAVLKDMQDKVSLMEKGWQLGDAAHRQPTPIGRATSMTPHSETGTVDSAVIEDLRQKISDLLSVVVMVERRGRTADQAAHDLVERIAALESQIKRNVPRDESPLLRRKHVFNCLSCNSEAEVATQQGRAESAVLLSDMVPSGVLHKTGKTPTRPGPYTTPNGRPQLPHK